MLFLQLVFSPRPSSFSLYVGTHGYESVHVCICTCTHTYVKSAVLGQAAQSRA